MLTDFLVNDAVDQGVNQCQDRQGLANVNMNPATVTKLTEEDQMNQRRARHRVVGLVSPNKKKKTRGGSVGRKSGFATSSGGLLSRKGNSSPSSLSSPSSFTRSSTKVSLRGFSARINDSSQTEEEEEEEEEERTRESSFSRRATPPTPIGDVDIAAQFEAAFAEERVAAAMTLIEGREAEKHSNSTQRRRKPRGGSSPIRFSLQALREQEEEEEEEEKMKKKKKGGRRSTSRSPSPPPPAVRSSSVTSSHRVGEKEQEREERETFTENEIPKFTIAPEEPIRSPPAVPPRRSKVTLSMVKKDSQLAVHDRKRILKNVNHEIEEAQDGAAAVDLSLVDEKDSEEQQLLLLVVDNDVEYLNNNKRFAAKARSLSSGNPNNDNIMKSKRNVNVSGSNNNNNNNNRSDPNVSIIVQKAEEALMKYGNVNYSREMSLSIGRSMSNEASYSRFGNSPSWEYSSPLPLKQALERRF